MEKINRRKALERTSLLVGGILNASVWTGVLSGCKANTEEGWQPKFLTNKEVITVANYSDIIVPKTDTPGASECLVHRFIDEMLFGYLEPNEQGVFREGLKSLIYNDFDTLKSNEKTNIVQQLAKEQTDDPSSSFFYLMKSMILLGYFTSEMGSQQALNYDPIPGEYEGCIPIDKYGGKTWAL